MGETVGRSVAVGEGVAVGRGVVVGGSVSVGEGVPVGSDVGLAVMVATGDSRAGAGGTGVAVETAPGAAKRQRTLATSRRPSQTASNGREGRLWNGLGTAKPYVVHVLGESGFPISGRRAHELPDVLP